jgi:glycerol uptake facilitator-like aquaporin
MVAEATGAFFLAFLYLTQTEEETKLSKDPAISAMIISASYVAAILMSSPPDKVMACLNPAIGISTIIVQTFIPDGTQGITWIWLYGGFPLIGGVVAVVFHELVYKKVVRTINESEEQDEGLLDKTDE